METNNAIKLVVVATLLSVGCATEVCDVVADKPAHCDLFDNFSPPPPVNLHEGEGVKVIDGKEWYHMKLADSVEGWQSNIVIDAAEEWSRVSNGRINFTYEFHGDFDFAAYPDNHGMIMVSVGKSNKLGYTEWWLNGPTKSPSSARIIFNSDKWQVPRYHFFYLTALHEIGHALGLGHNEGVIDSIMQPYVTEIGEHLHCVDQINVCEIHGCVPDCLKDSKFEKIENL